MNNTTAHAYYFSTNTIYDNKLRVVRFEGHSAIGECYEYRILLVSYNTSLNTADLFGQVAHLKIVAPSGRETFIHGTLCQASMKTLTEDALFFEVLLVPNMWYLQHTNYYQIFIKKSLIDIIKSVLDYAYMHQKIDYEFRLKHTYEPLEYITQYNESHFNFIKRLMEKYGLFFYFHQDNDKERLIICDERTFLDDEKTFDVTYRHGNTPSSDEEIVFSVSEHLNTITQKIIYQDYLYEHPSSVKQETLKVHDDGVGEVMSFNDNFLDQQELKRFAKVRSEIEACKKEIYRAKSTISTLYAGCIYHLHHCIYDGYNDSYLVTSITHKGDQSLFLASSIPSELHSEVVYNYVNEFTVIPADAPFRLAQNTPKPKIYGMISAKIDADGEGKYAQIDKWGRYKVKMPFDLSDKEGGKASTWLRMAQGSAGERMGMHFPLHKGTEVLVGFIGGDPDRPYINAAVPNILTPSPINEQSATQSTVVSDKNTAITWEDKDGSEYLKFDVPVHDVFTAMGWVTLTSGTLVSGVDTHTPNYQLTVEKDSYTEVKGTQNSDIEKRVETIENYVTLVKKNYEITAGFTKNEVYTSVNTVHGSDTSWVASSFSYVGFAFGAIGAAINIVPISANITPILSMNYATAVLSYTGFTWNYANLVYDSTRFMRMARAPIQVDNIDIAAFKSAFKKTNIQIETFKAELKDSQGKVHNMTYNVSKNGDLLAVNVT